jgi:trafficking protein particle complex subunit 13
LAYPSSNTDSFVLSPLLTLPPAFGSAYVGETFSCTLCANNELLPDSPAPKSINNVRIDAEMKVPSSPVAIPLVLGPEASSPITPSQKAGAGDHEQEHRSGVDLEPGQSLQKVLSFELKEEGSHVLAVTVTYTETTPTSGRVRTFRKLYQFVCKGCMIVRTKSGLLPSSSGQEDGGSKKRARKWGLEAQLENTGEETITLDMVILETSESFKSQGINWDVVREEEEMEKPVLQPGDVQQVCFIVEEVLDQEGRGQEAVDGRVIFGILSMGWRGPMGNRGYLSTGSLGARV